MCTFFRLQLKRLNNLKYMLLLYVVLETWKATCAKFGITFHSVLRGFRMKLQILSTRLWHGEKAYLKGFMKSKIEGLRIH